jgi:hypothetical protein
MTKKSLLALQISMIEVFWVAGTHNLQLLVNYQMLKLDKVIFLILELIYLWNILE